jgi:hypothetical protein
VAAEDVAPGGGILTLLLQRGLSRKAIHTTKVTS